MKLKKLKFTVIAVAIGLSPLTLSAQKPEKTPPKVDDAKSLKTLEDSIGFMRAQRLKLEARTDSVLARDISDRAKRLAMGGEVGALQQLELLLDSAQSRLLAQRDRIRLLKDGSQQIAQAMLVVLVRADALPAGDVAVVLLVDGVQVKVVTFKPDQAKTLTAGASEEVFRGEIAPVEHKIFLQVAGKGLSAGEVVTIPAAPRGVTYVEFVLKGGRLVPTTWTAKSSTF